MTTIVVGTFPYVDKAEVRAIQSFVRWQGYRCEKEKVPPPGISVRPSIRWKEDPQIIATGFHGLARYWESQGLYRIG